MSISLLLESFPNENAIKLVKAVRSKHRCTRAALGRHSKNLHFHSVLSMPIQHLSYRIHADIEGLSALTIAYGRRAAFHNVFPEPPPQQGGTYK